MVARHSQPAHAKYAEPWNNAHHGKPPASRVTPRAKAKTQQRPHKQACVGVVIDDVGKVLRTLLCDRRFHCDLLGRMLVECRLACLGHL